MQVFGRGAKFSMFKPAEEMVYIGLDSESRTKGKAAIDVVGAQSGKSAGAIFQQVLLCQYSLSNLKLCCNQRRLDRRQQSLGKQVVMKQVNSACNWCAVEES